MAIGKNLQERNEREHHTLAGIPVSRQIAEQKEANLSSRANHKKEVVWIQRDSMTRRNALLVGNEGSRRRNRYDNDNFTFHPLAILNPADLIPPGYTSEIPRFHFQYDETAAKISLADADRFLNVKSSRIVMPSPSPATVSPSARLPRALRRRLKKSYVPHGVVQRFDTELLGFLKRMIAEADGQDLEYEWVVVEQRNSDIEPEEQDEDEVFDEIEFVDEGAPKEELNRNPMYLVWEIGDRFSRWIVHTMCKYYSLASFSKTMSDGRRLTYVCHPHHLRTLSNLDSFDDKLRYPLPDPQISLQMPEHSFLDYLFH